MLIVGLAVTCFGGYDYLQQSDAISNAVTVDATITEIDVDTVSQGRETKYRPAVSFEYTYDGRTYTVTDLYPATVSTDYETKSAARAALAEYDEGETVTAYVEPAEPGQAFLVKKRSNGPLRLVGIGGILVVLAVMSLLRGLGRS